MTSPEPAWLYLTTRQEARVLQSFTCTTDAPRTPGGRKLPHGRPWEWEVQSYLRRTSQLLRQGQLVLVGFRSDEVVAAVNLQFETSGKILEVFIAAVGIDLDERNLGGGLADRILAIVRDEGIARAAGHGCKHLVLAANVHTRNTASQRMLERAGWEPWGVPSGDYQAWSLILAI